MRCGLYQTESLLGKNFFWISVPNYQIRAFCPALGSVWRRVVTVKSVAHRLLLMMGGRRAVLEREKPVFGGNHPRMDGVYPGVGGLDPGVASFYPGVDGDHSGMGADNPGVAGN